MIEEEWVLLQNGDIESPSGIVFPKATGNGMREFVNTVDSSVEKKESDMQDILLDAQAQALAKWWYDTTKEVASEYGLHVHEIKEAEWDEISDDNAVKQVLIAVCKKFLQSDFIAYTSDNGIA